MSFFILYDNKSFKVFNTAQDHKRVFEGDKGKKYWWNGSIFTIKIN